ncbi:MAG: hypothetical protein OXJ52_04145 [Oligoflexia bacterium]|nr:hypothetical protein [Oligoflexia bacterium]
MKKIKSSSLLVFKALSSFCVAYVLALIGRELLSFGLFSFVFLILSLGLSFFYLIKPYSFSSVFMLNLVLVASAVLLRFYVMTAYSS